MFYMVFQSFIIGHCTITTVRKFSSVFVFTSTTMGESRRTVEAEDEWKQLEGWEKMKVRPLKRRRGSDQWRLSRRRQYHYAASNKIVLGKAQNQTGGTKRDQVLNSEQKKFQRFIQRNIYLNHDRVLGHSKNTLYWR